MITIKHGAWEPYAHGATVHGHAAQDERPMEYYVGIDPPFFPMPALRDVRTLDLWLLYRPYPFQYVVQLRQSR